MPETMAARIEALHALTTPELRRKFREVFDGAEPPNNSREHLWRRIAWKIQEREIGGLSPDAQQKLGDLQSLLDGSLPSTASLIARQKERRLPEPGTVLRRPYKGGVVEVKVLEKGFEYQGRTFRTLTAVTQAITGSHWNGFLFFNLRGS